MSTKNPNKGLRSWTRTTVAFLLGMLVGFVAGVAAVFVLMIVLQAMTSYAG